MRQPCTHNRTLQKGLPHIALTTNLQALSIQKAKGGRGVIERNAVVHTQTRVAKAEEKTRSHAPPRWFPKALPGGPATTNALEKKKREATGSSRACDKAEQRFSNSPTTTPRSRREQICLVFILASRIPATTARLTTNTPFDKKVVHEALFSFYTHSQEEEEKRRK